MGKKAKTKSLYLGVTVVQRRFLKVSITAAKTPSKAALVEMIDNEEIDDIVDEETIETSKVESIEVLDDGEAVPEVPAARDEEE